MNVLFIDHCLGLRIQGPGNQRWKWRAIERDRGEGEEMVPLMNFQKGSHCHIRGIYFRSQRWSDAVDGRTSDNAYGYDKRFIIKIENCDIVMKIGLHRRILQTQHVLFFLMMYLCVCERWTPKLFIRLLWSWIYLRVKRWMYLTSEYTELMGFGYIWGKNLEITN